MNASVLGLVMLAQRTGVTPDKPSSDGFPTSIFLGIVLIVLSLYLMFNPLAGAVALPLVLGIFGIVGGVLAIIAAFRMR